MSDERRYWFVIDKGKLEYVQDNVTNEKITVSELEDLLNEQLSIIRRDEMSIKSMVSNMEKLEKENEQLKKDVENLQEVVAELGATLLMNGFEIKINDENLSELIDDE